MNKYRADLHIHTVLSPCGDLEMSPKNIVEESARKGLDIIAITDHNHTGHAVLCRQLAEQKGIWVVYGVELTSREDVHCLAFFDTYEQLEAIQQFIEERQIIVANDADLLGYQVIVDEDENIVDQVDRSLFPALNVGIGDLSAKVMSLGGLFVPAHVDRQMHGLYAQMGLFPEDMKVDAIEIHRSRSRQEAREMYPELKAYQFIHSSDAHFIEDVGRCISEIEMKERNFQELAMALQGVSGRRVIQG